MSQFTRRLQRSMSQAEGSETPAITHGEQVNETNTGYAAYFDPSLGRTLTLSDLTPASGTITSAYDGQIIEKLDLVGQIVIAHDNVIVRACRITASSTNMLYGVSYGNGYAPATKAVGPLLEYIELNGQGDGFPGNEHTAVNLDAGNSRGRYLYIKNFRNGVFLYTGDEYQYSFVENTYIFYYPDGEISHNTSMSTHGGDDMLVYRCNLQGGNSAAFSIYPEFSPVTNITVTDNLFNIPGGLYCTRAGGGSDPFTPVSHHIKYIGNKFGSKYNQLCGTAGAVAAYSTSQPGNEWTNNTWQSTGEACNPFAGLPGGTGRVSQLDSHPSGGVSAPSITLDASSAIVGSGLLAVIVCRDLETLVTAPVGWTLIDSVDDGGTGGGSQPNAFFYQRVAAVSETSYTWTFDAGTYCSGAVVQVADIDPANFIQGYSLKIQNTSNTHSLNAVTTTVDGTVLVAVNAIVFDGYTNNFDFPLDYQYTTDTGGDGLLTGRRAAVSVGFREMPTAGLSGAPTFAQQNANIASWVSCHIACNPQP